MTMVEKTVTPPFTIRFEVSDDDRQVTVICRDANNYEFEHITKDVPVPMTPEEWITGYTDYVVKELRWQVGVDLTTTPLRRVHEA